MTVGKAKLLLAAIISVRASAYLFSKILLMDLEAFTLMGIRFLAAFVLLVVVFHGRFRHMSRHVFLGGTAMGVAFFATMACELTALTTADSSVVAFLENTAIVLVPLAGALLARKAPAVRTVLAAGVALVGVGFMTLGQGVINVGMGELLGFCAALCYAAAMIVTDRFSKEGDTLLMGIVQVGWIGGLGMVCAFLFEEPCLPPTGLDWLLVAVQAVVCTGFGFTLQPMAQKPLRADDVSLMCALSPVVAALLGTTVLSEQLGASSLVGMALVLSSILVTNLRVGVRQAKGKAASHPAR